MSAETGLLPAAVLIASGQHAFLIFEMVQIALLAGHTQQLCSSGIR